MSSSASTSQRNSGFRANGDPVKSQGCAGESQTHRRPSPRHRSIAPRYHKGCGDERTGFAHIPPDDLRTGSNVAVLRPPCQSNAPKGIICSDMWEICDCCRNCSPSRAELGAAKKNVRRRNTIAPCRVGRARRNPPSTCGSRALRGFAMPQPSSEWGVICTLA